MQAWEENIIKPIFQTRKLRLTGWKDVSQNHPASNGKTFSLRATLHCLSRHEQGLAIQAKIKP